MLAAFSTIERALLAGALLATTVAGALHFAGAPDLATFLVSAVALAGLAWMVSFATEAIGERLGPAATGVLQSTLGNLPELFIVLFALAAGEVVVAQFSVLGSLFANALFVLGLVVVAGAWKSDDGVMRFHRRLPNDTATLVLLAAFIIAILGASNSVGDKASRHQVAISVAGAIVLLTVYAFFLFSYLRGARTEFRPQTHGGLPIGVGATLLAISGAGAALVSDWFVDSLDSAVDALGISKAFTGLVIVAIAGNAVENFVGIALAAKGQSDLAISVVKNSVAQIAVFLFPALVLLSLFFEARLTFVVGPVYVAALVLMAIAVWQVTGDGEAVMFEGWALVALYAVLAVLTFYE
jgi:Ca2+:H+ antiporter